MTSIQNLLQHNSDHTRCLTYRALSALAKQDHANSQRQLQQHIFQHLDPTSILPYTYSPSKQSFAIDQKNDVKDPIYKQFTAWYVLTFQKMQNSNHVVSETSQQVTPTRQHKMVMISDVQKHAVEQDMKNDSWQLKSCTPYALTCPATGDASVKIHDNNNSKHSERKAVLTASASTTPALILWRDALDEIQLCDEALTCVSKSFSNKAGENVIVQNDLIDNIYSRIILQKDTDTLIKSHSIVQKDIKDDDHHKTVTPAEDSGLVNETHSGQRSTPHSNVHFRAQMSKAAIKAATLSKSASSSVAVLNSNQKVKKVQPAQSKPPASNIKTSINAKKSNMASSKKSKSFFAKINGLIDKAPSKKGELSKKMLEIEADDEDTPLPFFHSNGSDRDDETPDKVDNLNYDDQLDQMDDLFIHSTSSIDDDKTHHGKELSNHHNSMSSDPADHDSQSQMTLQISNSNIQQSRDQDVDSIDKINLQRQENPNDENNQTSNPISRDTTSTLEECNSGQTQQSKKVSKKWISKIETCEGGYMQVKKVLVWIDQDGNEIPEADTQYASKKGDKKISSSDNVSNLVKDSTEDSSGENKKQVPPSSAWFIITERKLSMESKNPKILSNAKDGCDESDEENESLTIKKKTQRISAPKRKSPDSKDATEDGKTEKKKQKPTQKGISVFFSKK